MSSTKVILRTALFSILSIIGAAIIAFAVLSLAFPKTMAGFCEQTDNYSLAVQYANLNYVYSGDIKDLSRLVDDSIKTGKDKTIVKYVAKFVDHEKFSEECERVSALMKQNLIDNGWFELAGKDPETYTVSYKFFVCGELSAAQYRRKNIEGAISAAQKGCEDMQGFEEGNPFVTLSLEVIEANDQSAKQLVKQTLLQDFADESETPYFKNLIALLG